MTKAKIHKFLTNRIVDRLVENLIEDNGMSETQAMEVVYNSALYEQLQDASNQLYVQSPDHLYAKLVRERE